MVDWHVARKPRWSYTHLNRWDEPLGTLDGVTSCSVTVVSQSRLGGSGDITITERGQDIDWLRDRVQVIYDPGIPGVDAWPVATFMFTSPTDQYSAFTKSYSVTLTPKTSVVDSATVQAGFSIPAGANIIDTVVSLIESVGETRIAVTPSDTTLTNSLVYEEGASKLTVVNDLLTAANYWSLWCDGSGQFRVEPYTAPGDRPVSHHFQSGAASIHRPNWERTFNQAAVLNAYYVYSEGDEETAPILGSAVNEDPASPYSIPSRGFEVSAPPERVEVASQEEADALALRRLIDGMSPVARLQAEHAIIPLEPNQVVRFSPSKGSSVVASIQSMKYACVMNGHVDAEWREVVM
ncbi:MAG: hypothetical protein ACTIJ6_05295 [Leucobacter sp.]